MNPNPHWKMNRHWWLAAGAFLASATSANALCIYHGELYAKTTLPQEFRDSSLVVRGRVLSARDKTLPITRPDEEWGTFYRIKIEHGFKGKAQSILTDYTERNSGGFYLDVGKEYLLFLNSVGGGTMSVNYNCGQSRPWAEVPASDQNLLKDLSTKVR